MYVWENKWKNDDNLEIKSVTFSIVKMLLWSVWRCLIAQQNFGEGEIHLVGNIHTGLRESNLMKNQLK